MGVFLDFSYVCSTRLDWEFVFFSLLLSPTLGGGLNSTPGSEDWGRGLGLAGRPRDVRSGVLV